MSPPQLHNMKRLCKSDHGMLNKNNGQCMVDLLPTNPTNLQGKARSLRRCSNNGILVSKESTGRAIARLFLKLSRAHKVSSMLQGGIRPLRTNLARYLAVLVDPELWVLQVH